MYHPNMLNMSDSAVLTVGQTAFYPQRKTLSISQGIPFHQPDRYFGLDWYAIVRFSIAGYL